MVAAHNNTLEGVGILLSGLFVATSKGLDADLLAELCVLIYLCRLVFIFACKSSLVLPPAPFSDRPGLLPDYTDLDLLRTLGSQVGGDNRSRRCHLLFSILFFLLSSGVIRSTLLTAGGFVPWV